MVYTHDRVLFSLKKKGYSDIGCNIDTSGKHYAKWNKPATKGQILYDSTYIMYLKYSNSQGETLLFARGLGKEGKGRMGSCYLMGTKLQFYKNDNSFGDWLHNNVNVLNTTEHLKTVKMINLILCIFTIFCKIVNNNNKLLFVEKVCIQAH